MEEREVTERKGPVCKPHQSSLSIVHFSVAAHITMVTNLSGSHRTSSKVRPERARLVSTHADDARSRDYSRRSLLSRKSRRLLYFCGIALNETGDIHEGPGSLCCCDLMKTRVAQDPRTGYQTPPADIHSIRRPHGLDTRSARVSPLKSSWGSEKVMAEFKSDRSLSEMTRQYICRLTPEELEFAVGKLDLCLKTSIFLRCSCRISCLVPSFPTMSLLCQAGVMAL